MSFNTHPFTFNCVYVQLCGYILYTRVFWQPLELLTPYDVAMEGFPDKTAGEFQRDHFAGVALTTSVLVLHFHYFPL